MLFNENRIIFLTGLHTPNGHVSKCLVKSDHLFFVGLQALFIYILQMVYITFRYTFYPYASMHTCTWKASLGLHMAKMMPHR
jgi:hypothetical protein